MIPSLRIALAVGSIMLPSLASAQDRDALLLPLPTAKTGVGVTFGRATPGVTASSPLAFGPKMGDIFAGGSYQLSMRYVDVDDLNLMAGFGLGDPVEAIGLEAVVSSLGTFRTGASDKVVMSFKASRILPNGIAVAAGIEGVRLTGGSSKAQEQSIYGAVSKVVDLTIPNVPAGYLSSVTLNVGVGDGRFCGERIVNGVLAGVSDCGVSVFASAGLRVSEWAGFIADWTGQDLALSASFVPFKKVPFVIAPGLADIVGNAGDGVRFVLGFGMTFQY